MKKIFTLFAGLMMAAAVFAADHRPAVMLKSYRDFRVVIDGKSYFGDRLVINLDNLYNSRRHTIRVYEMRRGFFQRERLVDASSFFLTRNDLMIHIDRSGQIRIAERINGYGRRAGRDWSDREWNNRDWNDRDFNDVYEDVYDRNSRDNRNWENDKPVYDDHDRHDRTDGRGRGF